jgi:hypothetical protein
MSNPSTVAASTPEPTQAQKLEQLKRYHTSLKTGAANGSGLTFAQILQLIEEILEVITPLVKPAPAPTPSSSN